MAIGINFSREKPLSALKFLGNRVLEILEVPTPKNQPGGGKQEGDDDGVGEEPKLRLIQKLYTYS